MQALGNEELVLLGERFGDDLLHPLDHYLGHVSRFVSIKLMEHFRDELTLFVLTCFALFIEFLDLLHGSGLFDFMLLHFCHLSCWLFRDLRREGAT